VDIAVVKSQLVMGADGRTEFLGGGLVIEGVVLLKDGGGDVDGQIIIFPRPSDHIILSLQ